MMNPPFERTVCACDECKKFCHTMPGVMLPSDVMRIRNFLVRTGRTTGAAFWKLVQKGPKGWKAGRVEGGKLYVLHMPTITPKLTEKGCVFLTPDDRCSIHDISGFGCAYFSAHMDAEEGNRRSAWGFHQVVNSKWYQALALKLGERNEQEK